LTFADVKNRVFFLTGTDANSFTNTNLTLSVGRALERVVSLINRNDSRWEWDDSNYTDLPFATLPITSGQQQYTLATSHQTINRIEIKNSAGNWARIIQIDQQALKKAVNLVPASGRFGGISGAETALALGETTPSTGRSGAYQATAGTPTEYDLIGIRFFLFPVPNYTQAKSIRIYFTRNPLLFDYALGTFTDATGSTSSEPGFNSLFHDLIPLWASYDYGLKVGKQNTNQIFAEIVRKEQELVQFYGMRNRDFISRLSPSADSNR
jgi:hypothetical protein